MLIELNSIACHDVVAKFIAFAHGPPALGWSMAIYRRLMSFELEECINVLIYKCNDIKEMMTNAERIHHPNLDVKRYQRSHGVTQTLIIITTTQFISIRLYAMNSLT